MHTRAVSSRLLYYSSQKQGKHSSTLSSLHCSTGSRSPSPVFPIVNLICLGSVMDSVRMLSKRADCSASNPKKRSCRCQPITTFEYFVLRVIPKSCKLHSCSGGTSFGLGSLSLSLREDYMLRTIDHGFFTDMIGVLLDRKLFIRLATLSSCTYYQKLEVRADL